MADTARPTSIAPAAAPISTTITGHAAAGLPAPQNLLLTHQPRLLNQVRESRSQKIYRLPDSGIEKHDLVVCNELGYVSFDKAGGELLFTHLGWPRGV